MNIHRFQPDSMEINSNIAIIGRRHSGKTTLMRDLLRRNDTDLKIVFNHTVYDEDPYRFILVKNVALYKKQIKQIAALLPDVTGINRDLIDYIVMDYVKVPWLDQMQVVDHIKD